MSCGICWDDFVDSDLIYTTSCNPVNHKFHISCLQIHYKLNNRKECPYCRQVLNITSYKSLYPVCNHIFIRGKNKGNQCSKIGQHEKGFCYLHKKKVLNDSLLNEPLLNDSLLNEPLLNEPLLNEPLLNEPLLNEKKCISICKTGNQCKNNKKNGINVCAIHNKINIINNI
jgi:hypothetical protein